MAFPLGSAISAGAGFLSSLFTNSANSDINERNLEFQKYQYEDSKKYNSAPSVVARLRAAGINPALAFGAGQTGMAAASPVHSPTPIPMQSLDLGGVSSLANSLDLNRSKKHLTDSEKRLNDIRSESEYFELSMNKAFGPAMKSVEVQRLVSDATRNFQQALLFKEQGNTERSEQALNRAEESLKVAMKGLTDEQKNMVLKELDWYDALQASKVRLQSAQAGEASTAASRNVAEAVYYRAAGENQRAQAELTKFEKSFKEAIAPNEIAKVASEAVVAFNNEGITSWQAQAAKYAAASAKVQADWAEAYAWKDFILSCITDGAGSIADAYAIVRNSNSWRYMSDTQRANFDAKVKAMENDAKTETSTTTWKHRPNGGVVPVTSVTTRKRVRK